MTEEDESLSIPLADPKAWWKSRGVVGALMVIVSQVSAMRGVEIGAAELTELVLNVVGLVGGVLALIGRVRAQQPIARRNG